MLFHLGYVALPTYGVLAAVGLVCGLLLSSRTARLAGVDEERLWNAGLFAVVAAFVASRALLVAQHFKSFVTYPVLLLAVPSLTASGLLLTVVATLVWLWWKQIDWRRALDAWAPCAALVWGFLAVGHWAEGSDPGLGGRPVALYAAGLAFMIAGLGVVWLRRVGTSAGVVLVMAGVGQFFLSFWRVPGEVFRGLEMLQWVAVGMVIASGVMLTVRRSDTRRNADRPGASG